MQRNEACSRVACAQGGCTLSGLGRGTAGRPLCGCGGRAVLLQAAHAHAHAFRKAMQRTRHAEGRHIWQSAVTVAPLFSLVCLSAQRTTGSVEKGVLLGPIAMNEVL